MANSSKPMSKAISKSKLTRRWLWGVLLVVGATFTTTGCVTVGSTSKAPLMKVHVGGSKSDRQQEFLLKQIKAEHRGSGGIVLGLRHFTDGGKRPISGAREKDTLYIEKGAYKGSYTIDKVLRLVSGRGRKRKRRVIIRINETFFNNAGPGQWKNIHTGKQGVATSKSTFTDAVTDAKQFPPEVPVGSQLVLTTDGQTRYFTIIGNTIDRKVGKLQRVAYRTAEPLPQGLKNLSYSIRAPSAAGSKKLKYRIAWRGGGLSGYNFTIGINRRRYGQSEVEDLLKSNPASKEKLKGVKGKRNAAAVLRYAGIVTMVVGGFLALVRRDDFPGALQVVPWSIVGGGVLFLGISIPLGISANNDFLAAGRAYNDNIRKKLELPKLATTKTQSSPNKRTVTVTTPAPAKATLFSTK